MSKKHLKLPLSLEDIKIIGIEEPLTKDKIKDVSEVEFFNNRGLIDVRIKKDGNMYTIFSGVDISDVKSAVNGLLEDIELECKPYDMLYGEVGSRKLSFEEIKDLIKKWFGKVD